MSRLTFVIVLLIGVASCKERNPEFCPDGIDPAGPGCLPIGNVDAGTDTPVGPTTCTSSTECTAALPACDRDVQPSECVRCTADEHAACTGTTPVCAGHACVACTADDQCGTGGLCLTSGACAAPAAVIHAISNNGNTNAATCGALGPATACSLSAALAAVSTTRNVIKLDDNGTYTPDSTNFAITGSVTIYAGTATLHRKNAGPILSVTSGAAVSLYGATIEQASGGDGINCNGGSVALDGTTIQDCDESAIDATSCTVSVTRAKLAGNSQASPNGSGGARFVGLSVMGGSLTLAQSQITATRGGGITVGGNAQFNIVGNAILGNGDTAVFTSGVMIATSLNSANRFEFNTVVANQATVGGVAGVQCAAGALIAKNNIIWNNNGSARQVTGSCTYSYSDIGPTGVPPENDSTAPSTNLNVDPMLANEQTDPHLQRASVVRGKADPAADLTGLAAHDIDGHLRSAPADLGADQTVF